jgi:hypothetical protein
MLPSSLQPLPRSRTGQPPHFIGGGGPRPGVLDEEAKAALLAAADEAMYTAKKKGKNQVTMTALLADEDRAFVETIRRRLFSTFLLEWGRMRAEDWNNPPRPLQESGNSRARLARHLGWVDAAQLSGLLREQRRIRQPFHDVALATGLLSPGQVASLLAIQRQSPEVVGPHLVAADVLREEVLQEELRAYYQHLQEKTISA